MTNNQLVASRVRRIREGKQYLQKDIAVKLKISGPSYSRIEAGKTPITIDLIFKIAELLNENVYSFLSIENSSNKINSNNDSLLKQKGTNHSLILMLDKEDLIAFVEFLKVKKLA